MKQLELLERHFNLPRCRAKKEHARLWNIQAGGLSPSKSRKKNPVNQDSLDIASI
jgi:hypothetical protein